MQGWRGSGGSSHKQAGLPGGGGVDRFCQTDVELPRKQCCSPNTVLCHLDPGGLFA